MFFAFNLKHFTVDALLLLQNGIIRLEAVNVPDMVDAEWEKVIRMNLTGVFTMCSAIYPYLIEHSGGRIVNVASVADKIGGKYHISCNEVCPSLTKMLMTSALTEEMNKRIISMIPLGRAADPSESAQMILFFASDAASLDNGEIGDCDGGIVLD